LENSTCVPNLKSLALSVTEIYGNLYLKIRISQNGKTLIFWKNGFTIGFAAIVELYLQKMGDFYEKLHFTIKNFKF